MISLMVLLIKFAGFFTIYCSTFFTFLWKQSKSVIYVFNGAVFFFKNLKHIVKHCESYSNITIFLIMWKLLVFNRRNWRLFLLLTYFSAIMLEATQKIDQSTCCKNVENYIKICREKKCGMATFWINVGNEHKDTFK